jgi:hypothetical protein
MTECLIVQNATITLLFALGCYMVARYGIRCGGEANHAGKRVLSRSTQVSHRVRPVLGSSVERPNDWREINEPSQGWMFVRVRPI